MKRFALIGAAGYVAPRHMKAIYNTSNYLSAVLDPFDSLGVIDSYFPAADYFREPERFDRQLDKLRREPDKKIDYVSICSPNYLHDAHIRLALRNDANAICEKPLVLNPWNVDALQEIEEETGHSINVILQVRLHPAIQKLKQNILNGPDDKIYDVDLTYITGRGKWYFRSWKGDKSKSGGIPTNIGIHFFDLLIYLFGDVEENIVHHSDEHSAAGYFKLKRARVRWFLSLDTKMLPENLDAGQRTYRSICVDGNDVEFSGGFTDLHTESYKKILNGEGFTTADARPSIQTVYEIRKAIPDKSQGEPHPFIKKLSGI